MPAPRIVDVPLSEDQRTELARFVSDHWRRTEDSRRDQLDKYEIWEKLYRGIPAEETRNVPWYKSSNYVVKLIRIFLDTFAARTLNIVFSTRPLYVVEGYPREVKEALEAYLYAKAQYDWGLYKLAYQLIFRGNKNGTAIVKTPYLEDKTMVVVPSGMGGDYSEQEIIRYSGPRSFIVPFEDFAVYPTTANDLTDPGVIKFHRIRYVEEYARRMRMQSKWDLTEEDLTASIKTPNDAKRLTVQQDAGVYDPWVKELQLVETHLDWELGGRTYNIVSLLNPATDKLVRTYFNPYPNNWDIFNDYRPFPREDFFYGESMCELLDQSQEEISTIHNDRRNNSFIANAPVFKRRNGSMLPNPSTNWYPGKVFDVDDMADFDVVVIGRNYNDTLTEEQYGMQLAERLSGIGAVAQGYAGGMMGKRGIYNATGTLAIMSESNQRQDTNIRDVREALGAISKTNLALQAAFDPNDPAIGSFSPELQQQIAQALQMSKPTKLRYSKLEVKSSNAANNQEIERQNLFTLAQVVNNYGGAAQQIAQQLLVTQNPALQTLMTQVVDMMRWTAGRLLRAFNEFDAEERLPDVTAAIQAANGGGGQGFAPPGPGGGQGQPVIGANGAPASPLSREGLEALSGLLAAPQGNAGAGGVAGP